VREVELVEEVGSDLAHLYHRVHRPATVEIVSIKQTTGHLLMLPRQPAALEVMLGRVGLRHQPGHALHDDTDPTAPSPHSTWESPSAFTSPMSSFECRSFLSFAFLSSFRSRFASFLSLTALDLSSEYSLYAKGR
jgi:hypothetical protein